MTLYNIVASTNEATVVAECPPNPYRADSYQSEADMVQKFRVSLALHSWRMPWCGAWTHPSHTH